MIPLIVHVTKLARFAGECWRETRRLRREFPDARGE